MGRTGLKQRKEGVSKSHMEKSPESVQRKMYPNVLRRFLQTLKQNKQEIELGLYPDKEISFLAILFYKVSRV